MFKTDKEKENVIKAFIEAYGGTKTNYYVNWAEYNKNENYREKINYYYLIALNLSRTIEEYKKFPERYKIVSEKEALLHNMIDGKFKIRGKLNVKFVNKENGREIVFTHDLKKIVKDTTNIGTFNYYTYKGKLEIDFINHTYDIKNWEKYGTGINDMSSVEERSDYFKLSIEISIFYDDIKKWATNKNITHIGRKELNEYYKERRKF